VAANVAEGHERHDLGDYLRHLSFAQGSLAEVETDLSAIEISCDSVQSELATCFGLADEVGRMLTTMNAKLRVRRAKQMPQALAPST
jgi:four helix bundle protein